MLAETDLQKRIEVLALRTHARAQQFPAPLLSQLTSRLMLWSMKDQHFKTGLFRFIDLLPNLKTPRILCAALDELVRPHAAAVSAILPQLLKLGLLAPFRPSSYWLTQQSTKLMASQFIAGETMQEALPKLLALRKRRHAITIDLLGEYCVSEPECEIYVERYLETIRSFKVSQQEFNTTQPILQNHPGELSALCLSVKCSALYSQIGPLNFERSVREVSARLARIAEAADEVNAQIYLDAEDTATNTIILECFLRLFSSPRFKEFRLPGFVLQVYAKDSERTLQRLIQFAKDRQQSIAIRLVKGAYWDSETLLSIQNNLPSPLFAHKSSTDAQFERLTRICFDERKFIFPAIASHNVRSLAHAVEYAKACGASPLDFEVQMLVGMAEHIAYAYEAEGLLTRLYVPLGNLLVGMGYFMRRLLENTSNESFLRQSYFEAKELAPMLKKPEYHPEDIPI